MEFSLSLLRHRLASRRAPTPPPPDARPEGRLLWAHFGRGLDPTGARLVLDAVSADDADLHILSTGEGCECLSPADTIASGVPFLDGWSPDLAVFFGSDPFPSIWSELLRRGVPVLAAETDTARLPMSLVRAMSRFDAVLAAKPDARLGPVVEPLGRLSVVPAPPPATRGFAPLRQSIAARPVWLALDVPLDELEMVLAAHERVSKLSHRLLLILAADQSDRVRSRLEEIGWRFALRSIDDEPRSDDRILLVDEPSETGDWLRLAPVTYLGGTLTGQGPRTSPLVPAALGSALIHGARPRAYRTEFARLRRAGAARQVRDATALAAELERLQSPEVAAGLARAGWRVVSTNADASARLVELVTDTLAGIDV